LLDEAEERGKGCLPLGGAWAKVLRAAAAEEGEAVAVIFTGSCCGCVGCLCCWGWAWGRDGLDAVA